MGIVGEIYVRSNRFSNGNLIQKVEEFGGQAWLAPIGEWVSYLNYLTSHRKSEGRIKLADLLRLLLVEYIQHKEDILWRKFSVSIFNMGKNRT